MNRERLAALAKGMDDFVTHRCTHAVAKQRERLAQMRQQTVQCSVDQIGHAVKGRLRDPLLAAGELHGTQGNHGGDERCPGPVE